MLKYALILPALLLGALGAEGLYNASPGRQSDFIIAGLELTGAVLLIGLAFILRRRSVPDPEPLGDSADRAEVIERLRRHTEALRMAEDREHTARRDPEPASSFDAPVPQLMTSDVSASDQIERREIEAPFARAASSLAEHAGEPEIRGKEPGEAVEPPVRLPAIMLLNVGETAGPADIESAPPLGPKGDVLMRLREILPDLEVDAAGRSQHTGPDHSVRLDLGAHDIVHTVVIEASGKTGVSLVRWLLETTGWRAFVPKIGHFVEADALEGTGRRDGGRDAEHGEHPNGLSKLRIR